MADLPETVMTIFQEAIDTANKGLVNWIFKHRGMKLLSVLSLPCILPADIVYATFNKWVFLPSVVFFSTLCKKIMHAQIVPWLWKAVVGRWASAPLAMQEIDSLELIVGASRKSSPRVTAISTRRKGEQTALVPGFSFFFFFKFQMGIYFFVVVLKNPVCFA